MITNMGPMNITIETLESADESIIEAFARLIPQLSTGAPIPDQDQVARVLAHPANTVFAARAVEASEDHRILGLLTLVMLELPTGTEARIEDVVVDVAARGRGLGRALMLAALDAAARQGAEYVDLTSAPRRVAARQLYQSLGFVPRDTGVFRHALGEFQ
jgi:ribosomal protein S18 acetylase RimI-like enzyme